MSGKQWVRITAMENIPLREGRAVNVGGREIAIFNLGDRVLAVDGRCPHKSGPLAEGIVTGNSVVCPLHAWKISLETGSVTKPETEAACVATYRTRVESGIVLVEVPETSSKKQENALSRGELKCAASGEAASPSPAL